VVDRAAEFLGEGDRFGDCACAPNARPTHQRGLLRRRECVCDRIQTLRRVGRVQRLQARRLGRRVPEVHRDRDEHGSARGRHRQVVRLLQRVGHIGGVLDLIRPLRHGARHAHQVARQQRLVENMARVLLPAGDNQRRAVFQRGEQHAHRVAQSWRDMQVHQRGLPARLRVAVRHRQRDALLQRQHIAHAVGQVHQKRQLGRARIAEDIADAARPHPLEGRLADVHRQGIRTAGQDSCYRSIPPARIENLFLLLQQPLRVQPYLLVGVARRRLRDNRTDAAYPIAVKP
jgi:hypothetical protein